MFVSCAIYVQKLIKTSSFSSFIVAKQDNFFEIKEAANIKQHKSSSMSDKMKRK